MQQVEAFHSQPYAESVLIVCYFGVDFLLYNKTYVIDFTTITISYDNKNNFFCVKPRCLRYAIALQFPQRVVPSFVLFFSVSKPELYHWKLCLVSQETAVFTPYFVILITVTGEFRVCT